MPQIYLKNSSLEAQFEKEINKDISNATANIDKKPLTPSQKKKQKPAELVHNLIGERNGKNAKASITGPRNLDVFMKGSSVLDLKGIKNSNNSYEHFQSENQQCYIQEPIAARNTTKPVIAGFAKTTRPVTFVKRVAHGKHHIKKPSKKSQNSDGVIEEDHLLERTSSMGFDSPCFVINKSSGDSQLGMSSLPLQTRPSSSIDVQQSVEDKFKMLDQMEDEFYKIINKMTMENETSPTKSSVAQNAREECKPGENVQIVKTFKTTTSSMEATPIESKDILNPTQTTGSIIPSSNKNIPKLLSLLSKSSTSSYSGAIANDFDKEITENSNDSDDFTKVSKMTVDSSTKNTAEIRKETSVQQVSNGLKDSQSLDVLTEKLVKHDVSFIDEVDYENRDETEEAQRFMSSVSSIELNNEIERIKNKIRNEDIISVKGNKYNLLQKDVKDENDKGKEYLEKKKFKTKEEFLRPKTIHHFCITQPTHTLDKDAKYMSRFFHTPARYKSTENTMNEMTCPMNTPVPLWKPSDPVLDESDEVSNKSSGLTLLAQKIMNQLMSDHEIQEKNFMKLQQIINEMFHKNNKENTENEPQITGTNMSVNTNNKDRLFQTAIPPKFALPPYLITETLAPEYVGISDEFNECILEGIESEYLFSEYEYAHIVEDKTEDEKASLERILNRKHHSAMAVCQSDKKTTEDFTAVIEESTKEAEGEENEELVLSSDEDGGGDDDAAAAAAADDDIDLESSCRFESVLEMRRKEKKRRPGSARTPHEQQQKETEELKRPHSQPNFIIRKKTEPSRLQSDYNTIMKEMKELSEVLRKVSSKKKFDFKSNGRCLTRSQSLTNFLNAERTLKEWRSESDINQQAEKMNLKSSTSRDLLWYKEAFWYKWFDEDYAEDLSRHDEVERFDRSSTIPPTLVLEYRPDAFDKNDVRVKMILEEIERLSEKISLMSEDSKLLGFHLCRRGACYRKIGDIKSSLADLNKAVELEPKLLDAYWHRHLIYRLTENYKKALEDLDRITTFNTNHYNAFRSRAEIYKEKCEISLAITNFSQAIRIDPKDPALYYIRAELLEERGDMILALDDYKNAHMHDKSDTRAIWKVGMYHFNSESWTVSVKDFTELLLQEPKNALAYLYRGRASANMFHYKDAIQDLSTSINLDPNNFVSFFHRGCLLRKLLPKKALQDFSVSLLLNSSLENVSCFMHRGILYTDLERYDQASWDFKEAISLNRALAPAHVNLGIIELKFDKTMQAVNWFNAALRMKPTYIRAYLCRAEAYEKYGLIDEAIKDYTRAIFMKPGVTDFRMARGRLLLKKGKIELASFHIRQCAEMNSGKTASVTKKAAIETFLKNFDKAIDILVVGQQRNPSHLFVTLLAKTYMKASRFEEAIKTFNKALTIMKPWNPRFNWPKEAANVFFHIGKCQIELEEYRNAFDSFNACLKINPDYAQAYFERGLSKMKLGMPKAVYDFNRTLAYKPKFYQAYLGRAAYYGAKERYTKAIMNCNEALKIKSNSLRAFLYRGALKFNIKAYQLAIKDLTAAIQIDCTCMLAYFNRAVCHHERKHFLQALRDYSIVLMSDSSLKMKALLNRGLLYYRINDIENALHDFNVVSEEYPHNSQIYHTIGLCYHNANRIDEAIGSFTKALQVDPFFISALLARGNSLIGSNHPFAAKMARRDYIRALHLSPQSLESRVNLAYSLQAEGQFMKAWNLFTRTLELKPDDQRSLEGRAMVSLQMSNTFGAFVDMNDAIEVGKTAELYTNRGVVNQALGHIVNAMQDFHTAIKLDVSYALAYYNAANVYFLHKQFQQAIAYYGRSIDWDSTDVCSFVNRGVAKSILKDHEGALKDFNIAMQLAPDWAHIYYNRGNVYFSTDMLEEADKSFTEAIFLEPNDALFHKRRADVRGVLGRRHEALQDYRVVIEITMKNETSR